MVRGSPGGDQQEQWITQMFLRHVHCGMNLQEAIDAPAWHSEHFLLLLAAHRAGRACWCWKAAFPPKRSRNCASAAMRSR